MVPAALGGLDVDGRTYRLPLRIREILYGSVLGGAESHTLLSSTHPHNELMRLCLLRRQSER